MLHTSLEELSFVIYTNEQLWYIWIFSHGFPYLNIGVECENLLGQSWIIVEIMGQADLKGFPEWSRMWGQRGVELCLQSGIIEENNWIE